MADYWSNTPKSMYEHHRGHLVLSYDPRNRERDETLTKIEYLTGCSAEKLLELFAAGWTLHPPEKPMSMEELANILDKE